MIKMKYIIQSIYNYKYKTLIPKIRKKLFIINKIYFIMSKIQYILKKFNIIH